MNDGKPPRRSLFSYILPYILIAGAAGLFIWLMFSNLFGNNDTIAESKIDEVVLSYSLNQDTKNILMLSLITLNQEELY